MILQFLTCVILHFCLALGPAAQSCLGSYPLQQGLTSKIAGLAVSRSFGDKDFKGVMPRNAKNQRQPSMPNQYTSKTHQFKKKQCVGCQAVGMDSAFACWSESTMHSFFFTSKAPTAIVAIVAIVIQKYTKLCVALCFVLLWRCWTVPEPQKQNADLSSLVLCAMPAMCRIRSWHSQCRAGDHCTRGSWRANQLCFLPAGSHAGWLGRWRVKTWKRDNSS